MKHYCDFTSLVSIFIIVVASDLFKPEPPVVGKVTHHSIELTWNHVKEKLSPGKRYRYTLQEADKNKQNWGNVYSGYGITKVIDSLEPSTEYNYRLSYTTSENQKSEYSPICTVKTTKEPLTGEALHKAILLDRKADVEKILDSPEGSRIIEIPDKFGNFPLMIAVNKNNLEMIELLINRGADVNAQNESGKTALMLAAFSGKQKIIQELRSNGATYDKRDRSGSTALHYAVDGGNIDTLQWMLLDGIDVNAVDHVAHWTPLLRCASVNSTRDVAETLIKFGADINAKDKENKTALMTAIINGNQPLVETLVEHGANLAFKNEYGKTAYDMAVAMERRRVIKYLDDYMEIHGKLK